MQRIGVKKMTNEEAYNIISEYCFMGFEDNKKPSAKLLNAIRELVCEVHSNAELRDYNSRLENENTKLKSEIEQLLKNRDADRKYYSNEIQSLIKNQKYEVEKLKGELKSEREWRHNTRIELLDRNKEIESLKEENAELKKEIIKKQLL